jgi:competence protein ComEC
MEKNKMHKTTSRITTATLAPLLILLLVPSVTSQTGNMVTVHIIDVGQGDSIFIDTSNKDVLIDGGDPPYTQTILNYLQNLDITHLHLVIATHMHEDHIGGLVDILDSTLTIDEVMINNHTHTTNVYNNFMTNAQKHTITIAQRGQTITLTDTANMTILNPVQPLEFSDPNDNSIITKLQAGNTSFLFTGDAEEHAEQSMLTSSVAPLKCDVLKVGHHGSNTATTQTFLDLADPTIAIISAGEGNTYKHPHNETLNKLFAKNIDVYTTIASGTIIIQTDGTTITLPDNPQPIPETPQNLTIPIFAAATLATIILYRRKLKNTHKQIHP